MSLNDITLTPSLVADLYPDVLSEQSGQKRERGPLKNERGPLNYLGNNEKNILILSIEKDAVYLADKHLNFLTTVLEACKLGVKDVAIINWLNIDEETKAVLTNELFSRVVLLFGIKPLEFGLPVNFPQFQVQEVNKITYLHAPALEEIANDIPLKKQLWASLKRLFCI
jgi:hypothetical protein